MFHDFIFPILTSEGIRHASPLFSDHAYFAAPLQPRVLHIGGIDDAAETQLLRQIVFAEVMAMEDVVPDAPVLNDRLTVPFDPAAETRPLESEQTQAAVQRSQEKPCYDSRAELLGAIDRASHHRCEDHGKNEIEGRLFREKALVRESDNDERGEENHHGAERDLQDS